MYSYSQDLNFDVSNVVDMEYMFEYNTVFNGNISNWMYHTLCNKNA